MIEITIISMYNGRLRERTIKRSERLCQILIDGIVVYDDKLDESGEHMHMHRVAPTSDFKNKGFINAVAIDEEGVTEIKFGKITRLINFGEKIGAIVDQGITSGELILIQTPDGEQSAFPVGYLLNAFSSSPIY